MILVVIVIFTRLGICRKGSQDKLPNGITEEQFFDTNPEASDEWFTFMGRPREKSWPMLQEQLGLKAGMVIGDIGCGTGGLLFIQDGLENWARNVLRHFPACGFKPLKEYGPNHPQGVSGIFFVKPKTSK